jgi:hypothetical protein
MTIFCLFFSSIFQQFLDIFRIVLAIFFLFCRFRSAEILVVPISAKILILPISIRRNPLVTGRGCAMMAFYLPLPEAGLSKRVFLQVLAAARLLGVPSLATEQYPRGLGPTVPELELARHGITPHPKTCFTMVLPALLAELAASRQEETRSVILCGIEAHACIQHTTLDLLDRGIEVHIPVDCVSSRSPVDRKLALQLLRQVSMVLIPTLTALKVGAFLTTSEAVILGLAPDAAHPQFRGLQQLVLQPAKDSGVMDLL